MILKSIFSPDWSSPPGDTIADILKEKGETPSGFAVRIGLPYEDMVRLLSGDLPITEDIAEKLARALGSTVQFWMNRETQYRKHLRKLQDTDVYHKKEQRQD